MDIGAIIETITGLFGVLGAFASTTSDFSGAWATLYDALSTLVEFLGSFAG